MPELRYDEDQWQTVKPKWAPEPTEARWDSTIGAEPLPMNPGTLSSVDDANAMAANLQRLRYTGPGVYQEDRSSGIATENYGADPRRGYTTGPFNSGAMLENYNNYGQEFADQLTQRELDSYLADPGAQELERQRYAAAQQQGRVPGYTAPGGSGGGGSIPPGTTGPSFPVSPPDRRPLDPTIGSIPVPLPPGRVDRPLDQTKSTGTGTAAARYAMLADPLTGNITQQQQTSLLPPLTLGALARRKQQQQQQRSNVPGTGV